MQTLASSKTQSWLSWFLRGVIILGTLVLIGRLIELQIIKGSYFKSLSEGNRIRRVPILAPRGEIIARGGELLAGNREVRKRVVFNPEQGYEKLDDLSGALDEEIITEWERQYFLGEAFGHGSGYLGQVRSDEVGKIDAECPEKGPKKIGGLIGRGGLEQAYECKLRGIDGEELIEVDTSGKRIRTLGTKEPVKGENIKTTIHYGLQKKISQLMNEEDKLFFGAIIVADPKGEVLALYSSPSFDPNIFIDKGKADKVETLLNDEKLPLFNRAIGGIYHPGSVFKPVVAVAALEEGKIDENFTYDDPGQITIKSPYGTFTYSNWYFSQYGRKEGEIRLPRAIARSTDTFFYHLGELLGVEKLDYWGGIFGLDNKTGIDLPGEMASLLPSPEWKLEVKGERWFLGNTYHMAIGQGDIALTPIGINSAISAIAANGKLCRPFFVQNSECKDLGLDNKTIDLVKDGMQGACTKGGTGFTFFDFDVPVACKTGTAETDDSDKTHAWFITFGPVDFPEIVVTVLVEKGGEGSYVAGPIAREIFDYWFVESRN